MIERQSKKQHTLIWLHVDAPKKPLLGAPCNACGVCCGAEPCPVARVFLWQFHGSCAALEWDQTSKQYRCGMVLHASKYVRFLPTQFDRIARRLVLRWIASGDGCDSEAEIGLG